MSTFIPLRCAAILAVRARVWPSRLCCRFPAPVAAHITTPTSGMQRAEPANLLRMLRRLRHVHCGHVHHGVGQAGLWRQANVSGRSKWKACRRRCMQESCCHWTATHRLQQAQRGLQCAACAAHGGSHSAEGRGCGALRAVAVQLCSSTGACTLVHPSPAPQKPQSHA